MVALTQAANARSRALLERLGFVEDGRFERFGALQVCFVLQQPVRPQDA